jgi:hypothetical protein
VHARLIRNKEDLDVFHALRSRCPWGLVVAVVAVTAVEARVARLDLELSRPESFDWRLARRAARVEAPKCDVLGFGTSMAQMGLIPRVIEHRTGRRSYNLAVCGGRSTFAYYYLNRAIRAGARPSAVLIDVHPAIISTSYKDVNTGWSDALGLGDILDMAWTARDPDFLAVTALARTLPSVYNRFRIREAVTARLAGRDWSFRLANLQHVRNLNRNQGAFVGLRHPSYHGEIADQYRTILLGTPRAVDKVEWHYLERFVALAAKHDVRVYWLIPPFVPALQHERDVQGLDARYDRMVERLQKRFPNVAVLDARRSGFEPPVFLDACHLDPQGGYVLSRSVADALGRSPERRGPAAPGTPRWVTLPRYQNYPIDVPIEDVNQSLLAVKPGAGAVR